MYEIQYMIKAFILQTKPVMYIKAEPVTVTITLISCWFLEKRFYIVGPFTGSSLELNYTSEK